MANEEVKLKKRDWIFMGSCVIAGELSVQTPDVQEVSEQAVKTALAVYEQVKAQVGDD